jgi:hypothetical protein
MYGGLAQLRSLSQRQNDSWEGSEEKVVRKQSEAALVIIIIIITAVAMVDPIPIRCPELHVDVHYT